MKIGLIKVMMEIIHLDLPSLQQVTFGEGSFLRCHLVQFERMNDYWC